MTRRRLGLGLALVLALGASAFLWARFLAGGPVGPIPGGALRGERGDPPASWEFARAEDYVDVEPRGGGLPWSTRAWFMVHDDRIHLILPSLFGRGLHDRLLVHPDVRIRLGGRLYDLRATPVDAEAAFTAIVPPLVRRQFSVEVGGPVRPRSGEGPVETWLWRLDPP